MGSVIQQLQRTIIFGGVLGAEVFSVESFSEHGYDTVGLINSMRNTVMNTVDLGRVCKLTRYMSQDTYKRTTDQACATHLQGANATAFLADWELTALKRLEKCAVVIQDQPWEWDPWLVKCTWKWVSRTFEHPLPRVFPDALSVGLHIRWGDMATNKPAYKGETHSAARSIPIPTTNAVIAGLTECFGPLSLRVYMENHDDVVWRGWSTHSSSSTPSERRRARSARPDEERHRRRRRERVHRRQPHDGSRWTHPRTRCRDASTSLLGENGDQRGGPLDVGGERDDARLRRRAERVRKGEGEGAERNARVCGKDVEGGWDRAQVRGEGAPSSPLPRAPPPAARDYPYIFPCPCICGFRSRGVAQCGRRLGVAACARELVGSFRRSRSENTRTVIGQPLKDFHRLRRPFASAYDMSSSSHEKDVAYSGEGVKVHDTDLAFAQLVDDEQSHDIKLRTMSWQKAMCLLFGDQVCLAILAQAWSFMVLGWVPALITTFVAGALFWISSLTMWKYMMKHPHIIDVCDLGAQLFGGSKVAYAWTGFMLLANNILLIGFHIFTGARIIQTLDDGKRCTVIWTAVLTVVGVIFSLPRSLNHVSSMSVASATCMGISILLFLVFSGIEDNPLQGDTGTWPSAGAKVVTTAFPVAGVTWVDCLNAVLNITFLWVPQILFPTFISEMERPQDFPKALAGLAGMSFVLFITVPIIGYHYLGQYAEAPSFGSLQTVYKKAGFAFVIVPTMVIGAIYCNVSAKFIYGHLMRGSRHAHSNTKIGWGVWIGVVCFIWILGFVFGSVVPSMGDFLSLLGAAFDSFFGFIYWAVAYYALYKTELWKGPLRSLNTVIHIFLMLCGLFLLGPGLYAAVEAIIVDYTGGTSPAFTCASNGI